MLCAFVGYVARVIEPLAALPSGDARVGAGANSVLELHFAYRPGRPGRPGRPVRAGRPRRPVRQGIHLEIAAGQFVGVIGHTGGGKTTLLSLLLRFYPAPPGTLLIDGQPLHSLGDEAFRRDVGLVPQEPFLLAASACENIAMCSRRWPPYAAGSRCWPSPTAWPPCAMPTRSS